MRANGQKSEVGKGTRRKKKKERNAQETKRQDIKMKRAL